MSSTTIEKTSLGKQNLISSLFRGDKLNPIYPVIEGQYIATFVDTWTTDQLVLLWIMRTEPEPTNRYIKSRNCQDKLYSYGTKFSGSEFMSLQKWGTNFNSYDCPVDNLDEVLSCVFPIFLTRSDQGRKCYLLSWRGMAAALVETVCVRLDKHRDCSRYKLFPGINADSINSVVHGHVSDP
jgi:hypothetical protein